MNKYIVLSYKNNIPINNLDINNLTRTNLFNTVLQKIIKIIKILDNVNLLSEESQKNLELYINVDIATKEREIIEKILKKEDYTKTLEKLESREKRVLNLFNNIITFLDKNIKKLQKNEDDYIDTVTAETTISKHNVDKIYKLGELKLNQINKILNKLKLIIDLLTNKNTNDNDIKDLNYNIKRIKKLENDINNIETKEKDIIDYDKYFEYHAPTVTENQNGELSLSI
jgi:hypothetical protein